MSECDDYRLMLSDAEHDARRYKARAEQAEAKCKELETENERLSSYEHIRRIMVFYANREREGDEHTQIDDIVREWKSQKRGE